jgi:antitoxin (DNA-binding transcriptional repressor) of toxin-antitoxin stability system
MRAVGIKMLKNRLSEYLRLAEAGEHVLVTDRHRVVAQLGPPPPERAQAVSDAPLGRAIRQGLITPAALPGAPPARPTGMMTLDEILADLDSSREDR